MLVHSVEAKLQATVDFLAHVGVPAHRLGDVIAKKPQLFGYSVARKLAPAAEFLHHEVVEREEEEGREGREEEGGKGGERGGWREGRRERRREGREEGEEEGGKGGERGGGREGEGAPEFLDTG